MDLLVVFQAVYDQTHSFIDVAYFLGLQMYGQDM